MPSNDAPTTFSATPTVPTYYVEVEYDNLTGRFSAMTGEGDRRTIHQSPLIDDLLTKVITALKAEHDGEEVMVYLSGKVRFATLSPPAGQKSRYGVVTALDLAQMYPSPDAVSGTGGQKYAAGYFAALSDLKALKNL